MWQDSVDHCGTMQAGTLVRHSVQTPSYAMTSTLLLAWDTENTQTFITVSVKFK